MRLEPGRGASMQIDRLAVVTTDELGLQELREKMVIAERLAPVVKRADEQAVLGHSAQQVAGAGVLCHRPTEAGREALQDGGLQQEACNLVRLLLEHLTGEVTGDVPPAAADAREPFVHRHLPSSQRSQVDAGRPALRGILESGHSRGVYTHPVESQELAYLGCAERQLGRPYLEDAASRSQAWQGERWRRPAAHTELRSGGQVLQKHGDHPPAGVVGDQVGIVDHDDERSCRGDVLGDRRQDACGHRRRRKLHPVGDHGIQADDSVQDGHQVAEEDERVVVGVVGLKPRVRPRVGRDPLRQRDRLAEPSGRGGDDERLRTRRQLVGQTIAAYEFQQRARRAETGLQRAQKERALRAVGRLVAPCDCPLRSAALATRHVGARDRSSQGGPHQGALYPQAMEAGDLSARPAARADLAAASVGTHATSAGKDPHPTVTRTRFWYYQGVRWGQQEGAHDDPSYVRHLSFRARRTRDTGGAGARLRTVLLPHGRWPGPPRRGRRPGRRGVVRRQRHLRAALHRRRRAGPVRTLASGLIGLSAWSVTGEGAKVTVVWKAGATVSATCMDVVDAGAKYSPATITWPRRTGGDRCAAPAQR